MRQQRCMSRALGRGTCCTVLLCRSGARTFSGLMGQVQATSCFALASCPAPSKSWPVFSPCEGMHAGVGGWTRPLCVPDANPISASCSMVDVAMELTLALAGRCPLGAPWLVSDASLTVPTLRASAFPDGRGRVLLPYLWTHGPWPPLPLAYRYCLPGHGGDAMVVVFFLQSPHRTGVLLCMPVGACRDGSLRKSSYPTAVLRCTLAVSLSYFLHAFRWLTADHILGGSSSEWLVSPSSHTLPSLAVYSSSL